MGQETDRTLVNNLPSVTERKPQVQKVVKPRGPRGSYKKKLSPTDLIFIREYLRLGSATKAYQIAKPGLKNYQSYKSRAGQMLNRVAIKERLAEERMALEKSIEITKKSLMKDAARLAGKAEEAKKYDTALKGVELQGKFIGAFDHDEDAADQYLKVLQKISVTGENVQINIGVKQGNNDTANS